MKKIKAIIIIALICWHGLSFGQAVFNKVYDNALRYDFGNSLVQLANGDIVIGGTSHNWNSTYDGIYLLRINSMGDTIWTSWYDLTPGVDVISTLVENNNLILLGGSCKDSMNLKSDAFLAAIDSLGNLLWFKRYGGIENERCFNILKTSDGGYLFCGWTTTNTNSSYEDAWAVKTDSVGNQQWQHQYGGTSTDLFSAAVELSTGYVFAGWTRTAANYMQAYLLKTDFSGNLIWQKDFGYTGWDAVDDIIVTSDGNLILAGCASIGSDHNSYLLKTDTAGNIIWERAYLNSNYEELYKVSELPSGEFVAAGTIYHYDTNPNQSDGLLLKVAANGDSIWMKSYEHYSLKEEYVMDMIPTNDGGFAITGYIINNTLPQKNDVWLVKVDSMGCDDTSCAVTSVTESGNDNFILHAYPNPFNESTVIEATVPANAANAELLVYDVMGKMIKKAVLQNGINTINIAGDDLEAGIYFYSLIVNGERLATNKMVNLKK